MYGSPPANDLNRPFLPSSGLLRYLSAPSSLFGQVCEDFLPVRPTSPETESMLVRFLSPDLREDIQDKKQPPPSSFSGCRRNPQFSPPPQAAAVDNAAASSSAAYRMLYQQQIAMETDQIKSGGSNNLVRQSSSPAGLFSHLNETGYGVTRGIGSFRNGGMGLGTRRSSSSATMMSQISEEMENESMGGYPIGSWEESPMSSENNFSGDLKRARDNQSQLQVPTLMEMAAIEKFLQFQDSVPCKIRAKRGCATHPRSIAERVRRTRISERMRKLQELVPNMDKQTNTADMLDLAVDYIKELQQQVKIVSDSRASCGCSSSRQKSYANSTA